MILVIKKVELHNFLSIKEILKRKYNLIYDKYDYTLARSPNFKFPEFAREFLPSNFLPLRNDAKTNNGIFRRTISHQRPPPQTVPLRREPSLRHHPTSYIYTHTVTNSNHHLPTHTFTLFSCLSIQKWQKPPITTHFSPSKRAHKLPTRRSGSSTPLIGSCTPA